MQDAVADHVVYLELLGYCLNCEDFPGFKAEDELGFSSFPNGFILAEGTDIRIKLFAAMLVSNQDRFKGHPA